MNIDVKSPWIIVAGIILITTITAIIIIPYLQNSGPEISKEIIDKKIEDKEVKYENITKNGDLVGRNYSDEGIHIATDLFDEKENIIRRVYYDKKGQKFASCYYSNNITYTEYNDSEKDVPKPIVPPVFPGGY